MYETEILTTTRSYIYISILTAWLMFLMNRALHFATKQNSRDIQKFNCFWVPSDDLFASARKAVFPEPTPTGVHRLKNTLSSQSVKSNLPQKSSTVLYEPKFGPPTSKIPGSASEFSDVVGYDPESIGALRNTTLGYLKKAFVWVHNSRRLIISIATAY